MEHKDMTGTGPEDDKILYDIILTLEAMDRVDDIALYARVSDTVRKKHLRRRRLVLLRNVAAAVLPILMAAGIWWHTERSSPGIGAGSGAIARHEGIPRLVLPDGREFVFTDSVSGRIAEQNDVSVEREGGALVFRKRKERAAASASSYCDLRVPKGTTFDIILEDGTRIWMNADSRLRYPLAFPDGERRVFLEGEAYFEVVHDVRRPFAVESGNQTLTVLGTRFNVSAYEEDRIVYTTLIDGKVALKAPAGETTLAPGMQARLAAGTGLFTQRRVKADEVIAWRDKVIVFENNTLGQMMARLARIYDMEFRFEDDNLANLLTHGTMPIQADVSVVLRLIEASGKVKFKITENMVEIKAAE